MSLPAANRAFYTGRGLTGIVMLVNCIGTLLDISLEYTFIFGAFGFPRLGIGGAGLTTAISNWSTVLMFWLLMRRPKERAEFGLDDHHFDWGLFRRLIRFGLPSGLPQLVESVAFSMLTIFIARASDVAGAATSIALTINAMAFVPMIGMNITVTTLVGQKLGENRPDLAERATWTAMILGTVYTGLFAMLYVAIPDAFLILHTAFAGDDFADVRTTTVYLLRFMAIYCLFDATQIVLIGAPARRGGHGVHHVGDKPDFHFVRRDWLDMRGIFSVARAGNRFVGVVVDIDGVDFCARVGLYAAVFGREVESDAGD